MSKKHRRRRRNHNKLRLCLAMSAVVLVLILGVVTAQLLESRLNVEVENAGMQMTAHQSKESTAQVFMNNRWYEKNNLETLLVMGIDDFGTLTGGSSYNNSHQADFLVLFIRDKDTGRSTALHLNRDAMTDITMLGVRGEAAGVQHAQLAIAYNYGSGGNDSSRNTADAVSNLLYGMKIDHYITVTMDAVPIMNDWVGGVEIEVLDDFSEMDASLVKGEKVRLMGKQALNYVRTRKGLDDSSNLNRMKRQRQYASAWIEEARERLDDTEAVAQLIVEMSECHYSDYTAEQLAEFAEYLSRNTSVEIFELPGEAVKGETFMEFHVDDEALQQLILELFYDPVV